jgi:hypothetical protein
MMASERLRMTMESDVSTLCRAVEYLRGHIRPNGYGMRTGSRQERLQLGLVRILPEDTECEAQKKP